MEKSTALRITENSDIDVAFESEPAGLGRYQLTSLLAERLGPQSGYGLAAGMPFSGQDSARGRGMDSAGLTILLRELAADCEVARDAAHKAGERARLDSPGHLEACAYELARFFNVLEKMSYPCAPTAWPSWPAWPNNWPLICPNGAPISARKSVPNRGGTEELLPS